MSGADIAAEVHAALLEAAQATGSGEFALTLIVPGGVDETVSPPVLRDPTEHTLRAMQMVVADRDKDGTNVRERDLKFMVTAVGPVVPEQGQELRVDGRKYSVQSVETFSPGGVPLYYKVRARGA